MKALIKLHATDNVAIAMKNLAAGEVIEIDNIELHTNEDIVKGHKIALTNISKDEHVMKYGAPIGFALQDIKQGDWVHTPPHHKNQP